MVSFPGSTPAGHAGENAYKGARLANTEAPSEPETPELAAQDAAEAKAEKKAHKSEDAGDAENATVSVFRSRLIYRNPVTHNSESVKQLQRRLVGLGFVQAGSDPAGLFADGTQSAVAEYQAAHDIESTGEVDAKTLKAIFRNAKGIDVILD